MGQSLVVNHIHIIFATKYRQKLIKPPVEKELHAYIGGVCNEMGCPVQIVGGYTDHIHILCRLSSKIALMDLVRNIKAKSSRWMKSQDDSLSCFSWNKGYAAFAVRAEGADVVINYIKNQHEHHSRQAFEKEFLEMLEREGAEYDEKFLWD